MPNWLALQREPNNLLKLFEGNKNYKDLFDDPDNKLWDDIVDKIIEFNPDWVGWFCYTASVPAIKLLSKKLKELAPHVKQVVGGPHSSGCRS